ncbi:SLATT domain-containing protein [Nocardia sp. NPDC004860]|uniref:SLATT domain-containing protein n=1 Tax=Nocardia sp. NPDC004860 TaxID=3154557 RepID=UPI0033A0FCBC
MTSRGDVAGETSRGDYLYVTAMNVFLAVLGDLHQSLEAEADHMLSDLLYTEESHFAAAEHGQRSHLLFGGIAAVSAAIAAASVIGQWSPVVAAVAALIASAVSAVLTLVNPQETAQKHLDTGRDLAALKVELRQVRNLDLNPASTVELADVRRSLAELANRKNEIDRAAPGLGEGSFRKAGKKIDRGDFVP